MRTATIRMLQHLSSPANRDGGDPVIKVVTDYPGPQNSFYMAVKDLMGKAISIEGDLQGASLDDNTIRFGDTIDYDCSKLFTKQVIWKGRKFKQYDYSFDEHKIIR